MSWYLLCRLTPDCKAYGVDGCQSRNFSEAQAKFAKRNAITCGTFRITLLRRGEGPYGRFYRGQRSEQIAALKAEMGIK